MDRHDLETRDPSGDGAGLGPRRASYPPEPVPWAGALLWGLFPVGLLALSLLAQAWPYVAAAVVVGAGYVAFLVDKRRQARRGTGARLDLHRHGVVVVGPGDRRSVFRWDTLVFRRSVVNQRKNGIDKFSYGFTLMGPDRVALRINETPPRPGPDVVASVRGPSFAEPEVWDARIRQAVLDAQLPAAVEALHAGETLTFGGVHVDRDGLRVGDATVAWSDVETARVVNAVIQVVPKGRGRRLQIHQSTPNFEIVWALIRSRLPG